MNRWRKHRACGDVVVVRYADDFVMGFQYETEAKTCLKLLKECFAKFGLKLHETKTRLIEFWRYAPHRRKVRGEGRPETFDFLGFTHYCSKNRINGYFRVKRVSNRKRMQRTLATIKERLQQRMHRPLGETGRWLERVVQGWLNDHTVPGNSIRLCQFCDEVKKLWLHTIRRRSHKGRDKWTWSRFARLAQKYLPKPRILHPTPYARFHARLKAGAG